MKQLFIIFFRLGWVAFGGPPAHLALIEQEYINKYPYLSKEEFLNFIGSVSFIPSPNSTQVVLLCGYQRFGILGMLVSGFAFILPASFLTLLLAILYEQGQEFSYLKKVFSYVPFAMFSIIIFSLIQFNKKVAKNNTQILFLTVSFFLYLFTKQELLIIFGLSLFTLCLSFIPYIKNKFFLSPLTFLFLKFLLIGSTLFGGGFNLIAYIQQFFQNQLSQQEILDAIAMGQFTPGPILTTATFIGYQLYGISGAILATIGIFLPSMIFVPLLYSFIHQKSHPHLKTFLDSANSAAVGVMNAVVLSFIMQSTNKTLGLPLTIITSIMCYFKINTILIVCFGLVYGVFFSFFVQG